MVPHMADLSEFSHAVGQSKVVVGKLKEKEQDSEMVMEFKPAEQQFHALPRSRADLHPLHSHSPPSLSLPRLRQVDDDAENRNNEEFYDPLRVPDSNASPAIVDDQDFESSSSGGNYDSVQAQTKEWTSFKRFLMQRFPVSKMISLSSMSSTIVRGGKALEKTSTSMHLEELEDPQKSSEETAKVITRQEYVSRLHELKDEINRAWNAEDRVTSLKLSIKVARLLMDTSVLNFYPTLFVLAADVLDMLGDMVWERIRLKAEFAEDGTENFGASDVCTDAKETCYNWFCKVGSIQELLPRIYLELAILPCWRFLIEQPSEPLHRLVMMTRGLADPLASSYCRLYIAHRAQKLPSYDTGYFDQTKDIGYLITCVNDMKLVFTRISSSKETGNGCFADSKRSLISLMEPAIEFIMKCLFKDVSLHSVGKVLVELGLGRSQEELFGGSSSVSVILYHILKELSTDLVSCHAVGILHLIKCSNDSSYDQIFLFVEQCLNYRLLGLRLSEQISQTDAVDAVLNDVIQVVSQYGLDEYLKVLDAYLDIILQNQMDGHLKAILGRISELACDKVIADDELAGLQSILVKLLSHFKDLEVVFSLNHFLEILDLMHGSSRSIVNMHILDMATRNGHVRDPTTIQLLFEISQALHDDFDLAHIKSDDNQQQARLISRFVLMVDHGDEYERHLAFLVECRGAFGSITELKEILVHSSNCLAAKATKDGKKHLGFVKSCIAFSEVTIPSISGHIKQLHLYLETAEVALLGGLVSHADGLIDSAINCLQSFDGMGGSRAAVDSDGILSSIRKLCSLSVMVPGDPEVGILHIPKSILSLINSQPWSPRLKTRIFCAIFSLSATLSQERLPYRAVHPEVPGNDLLFFGDSSYVHELLSLTESVLQNLVDVIELEPSRVKYFQKITNVNIETSFFLSIADLCYAGLKAARGTMSLEACNCIASSFKINEHVLPVCSKLIETAKSCLSANDRYLISTISILDKNLPPAAVSPSIAI
ncbi:Vacuolar protein sorting-associated protein 35 [Corchorus olitorius]|uniref:Vacuolar protein sorting-associated protein 35 n=1 Tax=Corchorus olitorius TaxID=93759 RepID=A0A1R3KBF8_9ROSI|nr:Vacuolar protein sorting-associated protein 35 [Corchorus olitorius]